MSALPHLIRKEFLQLRHDRRMIPMLLGAPVLQLVLLGFAANLDVTDVPMLLVDRDRTQESRELVQRFTGSGYFTLAGQVEDPALIEPWMIEGKAQIALVIRSGYADAVAAHRSPEVQVIADGTEANSSLVALSYATAIIAGRSRELVLDALRAASLRVRAPAPGGGGTRLAASPASIGRIELVPRIWYNPDLRSRWFYVPAILAMVLMLTTMILPSMAVVREKEIGTLEQLIVTPIRSWELILGKLLPFGILGMISMIMVTGLAVGVFGVPLRGSLLLLVLLSGLFLLNTLGLGLLTSTIARNQQQAMMGSIFLLMVPMIYLSGLIFPIANMPRVIRIGTYGIPLRYYNDVIRGIFLRGAGMSVLWPEAIVLLCYGLAILGLAALRFRKRLD